jgi:hypothetical protein
MDDRSDSRYSGFKRHATIYNNAQEVQFIRARTTVHQKLILALPATNIHALYGTLGFLAVFINLASKLRPEPNDSSSLSRCLFSIYFNTS